MRFGQLHLFERPASRTSQEIIDEQMDIMAQAEDYGFDSVWPAEHHFREYGHCATPTLTLAALAGRMTKIRLGTGVVEQIGAMSDTCGFTEYLAWTASAGWTTIRSCTAWS